MGPGGGRAGRQVSGGTRTGQGLRARPEAIRPAADGGPCAPASRGILAGGEAGGAGRAASSCQLSRAAKRTGGLGTGPRSGVSGQGGGGEGSQTTHGAAWLADSPGARLTLGAAFPRPPPRLLLTARLPSHARALGPRDPGPLQRQPRWGEACSAASRGAELRSRLRGDSAERARPCTPILRVPPKSQGGECQLRTACDVSTSRALTETVGGRTVST